jgi:hypothetical protein
MSMGSSSRYATGQSPLLARVSSTSCNESAALGHKGSRAVRASRRPESTIPECAPNARRP